MTQRLDVDRHGVPQFSGDPELYDEYEERAWDLWHGRDGQPALQAATAVHLRAGLSGPAYGAVRKMEHSRINPTDKGLKAFLDALRTAIAAVKPVRINELFLTAFYSQQVWRRPQESMQQYIIRREQDFRRLEEAGGGTSVPRSLRAMMLLLFGGLSQQEQVSVLSSVNKEYDFDKIANAMRIQFPQANGKPVHRRDFLGCGRSPAARDSGILFRKGYKPGKGRGRPQQILATEEAYEAFDDDMNEYDDEIFLEDEDEYESPAHDGAEAFWEDETRDTLVQDLPALEGNEEVAEALATVMQFKKGKGKGKSKGKHSSSPSSQSLPFKASGDISFDAKAKENRNTAVKFLKSVTACTSCGQKGHCVGDDACPNTRKKKMPKTGPSPHKKKSDGKTTFFVLHEGLESDDEKDINATFTGLASTENDVASEYHKAPVEHEVSSNASVSQYDQMPKNLNSSEYEQVPADEKTPKYAPGIVLDEPNDKHEPEVAPTASGTYIQDKNTIERIYKDDGLAPGACFTSISPPAHEVLMVLKDTQHCEHSSYFGGNEREFHRGANGHTRHLTCKDKDCNQTIIVAKRKDATQLWRYLVQIALCTRWGSAARSRELFASVCRVRDQALKDDEDRQALQPPRGYPHAPTSPVSRRSKETSSPSSPSTARIIRPDTQQEPRFWVYGVLISPTVDLPAFPPLAEDDYDVLQPLPSAAIFGPGTPYEGYTYIQIASSVEASVYCHQTLRMALDDQAMSAETYRFAFYLFGRVRLLHGCAMRTWKAGITSPLKRATDPDDMVAHRCIRVPICMHEGHPEMAQPHDFEVLMVNQDISDHERLDLETTYTTSSQDPPGLAILDSGCTRTMHGTDWAKAFEEEFEKLNLSPRRRLKKQSFKGVGGQIASDTVKIFPVGINKVNGELHSAEAPGSLPLLSRPFMEELQTVINIGARTVSFNKIGVTDLPLVKTSRGHLAVSLLDFDMDSLQDCSPEHATEPEETLAAQEIN